ncbi:MAG TPA: aryl-sulfate sulfotransferase [Candidatus Thermoplasmatota archaeon]|nr:aryl-sulfate sulfotransferase [Candidatus Thermoplasmatota archaeon]
MNENPANASPHVSVYLSEISFTVSDSLDDTIYYTVTTSPDFIGGLQCGTVASGETIHILRRNGLLAKNFTYVWWVNVTDDFVWINNTYQFTTVREIFQGYTLFTPINAHNRSTFLIDNNGKRVHTWLTNYTSSLGVYMVENGSILRPYVIFNQAETTAIQKITWNGTVSWDFQYFGEDYWQTHDVAPLPNGNVLILALERKTAAECIAAGRNPALLWHDELWPVHIVEVNPTGQTTGDIVWEWHLWDHLIQDFDPSKDNYGVIKGHPELLDINFAIDGNKDWIHPNTIHFNPELNQVIICSRFLGEFWIIDHSTTTKDAAKHTGGVHGRGGDFLYRWGNPQSYHAGDANDQKLFGPHDSQWISPGCPGEGHILIFNNGWGRPEEPYSSIDEITPPIDIHGNYSFIPGAAYGPENLTWKYTAQDPYSFNASFISGCERLPNGNTLICDGPLGFFFEVTMDGDMVWSYNNTDPYPGCRVFRVRRYYSPFCPPVSPRITGPNNATVGVHYNYTFVATDPDGDTVYYSIDWGDNTSVYWIGPYRSGLEVIVNHTWEAENNYIIQCQAKDRYGSMSNWSTLTANVGTPYQPNNPVPPDGTTDVNITVNLSWTGGDPDPEEIVTYDVYFGRINPPPKMVNNQTTTFFKPVILDYSSTYYWEIIAWDAKGKSTAGQIWDFTTILDITAPMTISSLNGTVGNNSWFISPVTVTLTANDTQSGINYTLYKVDNDKWTVYVTSFVESKDVESTISYYSVDDIGNIENTNLADLKIDTKAPQTTHTISGTTGNNSWYISNVTIALSAIDNISGVTHTYYQLDSGNWSIYSTPRVITNDGSHTIFYYSVDNAGNTELINGPFFFKIDKTPPMTTHSFSGMGTNQWYTSNVTVMLFAVDSNPFQKTLLVPIYNTSRGPSGINHTYYKMDNEIWSEYDIPFSCSIDGVHNLDYYSIDLAGNVETVNGPFTVKIDKTPPTISLIITAQNLLMTKWLLQANVSDATSGVYKVEFYIDNLLQGTVATPGPYEWNYEGFGNVAYAIVFDTAGNSNISPTVNCQDLQPQSPNYFLNFKQYTQLIKQANLS